jgi:hypothetical protein
MLDILTKHLNAEPFGCVVQRWIDSLSTKEQEVFAEIKVNNKKIVIADLFTELNQQDELPFKLTAFRSHLRGYCTCQAK